MTIMIHICLNVALMDHSYNPVPFASSVQVCTEAYVLCKMLNNIISKSLNKIIDIFQMLNIM